MSKTFRNDALAVTIVALLIGACFADVLFAGSCFFVRDLTRYYFPTKSVLHNIVASGELPLWNPYYSGGQPALANPEYELFYPGQWLIFLRDFFLGFRLHILLHFVIAAVGMYALMRSVVREAGAAFIAAISFAFSGPFLSSTNLLTTLFPLAWFPWVLLFLRRYLRDRRSRDLVFATLSAAMILLILEPGGVLQVFVLCAGYAIWHGRRTGEWPRTAGAAALPFVMAAGVAAVQVLPTLDFVRQTARARGLSFAMIATWSMPPVRLLELLQPHFLGRNPFLSNDYWGASQYGSQATPYFQSLYLGLLPLIALTAGLVRRDRTTMIGVSGATAGFVIAFGDHTPLLRLAWRSGFPLVLRFPERFATGAAFILLVTAGIAIARITSDDRWWRSAMAVTTAFAVIVAMIAVFAWTSPFSAILSAMWNTPASSLPRWLGLARADWHATLGRAALLVAVLAVARPQNRFRFLLLALFVVVDLCPYVNEIAPRMPRSFFDAPPVVAELGVPAASRIFFQPEWSNGAVMRHYAADRSTIYWVIRNGLFPRLPAAWGFATILERDIDLTNLTPSADLIDAFWRRPPLTPSELEPYAAIANVEWIAVFRPPKMSRDPSLLRPITFVRLPPSPRYYFADEAVRVRSIDDFVAQLARNHSARAAYVGEGEPVGSASVIRVAERANHVAVDTAGDAPALLVLGVTRDPHWHATIDGVPVPIVPANIAFQALAVPQGHHHVEMQYRNGLVVGGGVVTVMTLIALIAVLAASGRRRRAANCGSA